MTTAIITTCHTYEQFLPDWAASVCALKTQPDEIVICATTPERMPTWLGERFMDMYGDRLNVVQAPEGPWVFADALNRAVKATQSGWIAWIGCDDRYEPWALDGLHKATDDLVCFGLRFPDHSYIRVIQNGPKPEDVMSLQYGNMFPCGSPFRRHVWEMNPFDPTYTPYEDWAFSVQAAKAGFTFGTTGRVDFVYAVHDQQRRPDEAPTIERLTAYVNG